MLDRVGVAHAGDGVRPNQFVDVSDTLATKIAAMECYETELRDYPHPRSSRALRDVPPTGEATSACWPPSPSSSSER